MVHTVVIAPDSFKGTIGAADAAAAIAGRLASGAPARRDPAAARWPTAARARSTPSRPPCPDARRMPVTRHGPGRRAGRGVLARSRPTTRRARRDRRGRARGTSGIELLGTPARLRPLDAGTRGFGEAIAAALAHGVSRLVLGIGSSASTDGGTGMLAALGREIHGCRGPADRGRRPGLAHIAAADLSGSRRSRPEASSCSATSPTRCSAPGARHRCSVRRRARRRARAWRSTRGWAASRRCFPPIRRRRAPARPAAPDSGCSRGVRRSCPARPRSPSSSGSPPRWARHPSSSPAKGRTTASPPPARCRRTSAPSPPTRGGRAVALVAGAHHRATPTSRASPRPRSLTDLAGIGGRRDGRPPPRVAGARPAPPWPDRL